MPLSSPGLWGCHVIIPLRIVSSSSVVVDSPGDHHHHTTSFAEASAAFSIARQSSSTGGESTQESTHHGMEHIPAVQSSSARCSHGKFEGHGGETSAAERRKLHPSANSGRGHQGVLASKWLGPKLEHDHSFVISLTMGKGPLVATRCLFHRCVKGSPGSFVYDHKRPRHHVLPELLRWDFGSFLVSACHVSLALYFLLSVFLSPLLSIPERHAHPRYSHLFLTSLSVLVLWSILSLFHSFSRLPLALIPIEGLKQILCDFFL